MRLTEWAERMPVSLDAAQAFADAFLLRHEDCDPVIGSIMPGTDMPAKNDPIFDSA